MDSCVFCQIANKKIPTHFVFETAGIVAFKDIKPSAPVHYLIIPKEHVKSVAHLNETHDAIAAELIFAARDLADKLGLKGYKLVFNVGSEGGQVIDHLHLHLLGGWNNKTDIDAMPHPRLDK